MHFNIDIFNYAQRTFVSQLFLNSGATQEVNSWMFFSLEYKNQMQFTDCGVGCWGFRTVTLGISLNLKILKLIYICDS